MAAEVALSQIGQIGIPVKDVARATAFYRDRLGMRFLFTAPPGLAFFDCSGIRLMLSRPEGPSQPRGSSILYFRIPNLQQAYQTLLDRSVRFHGAPHIIARMNTYDLWMAFFYDSEDNTMALMSEVPRSAQ